MITIKNNIMIIVVVIIIIIHSLIEIWNLQYYIDKLNKKQ